MTTPANLQKSPGTATDQRCKTGGGGRGLNLAISAQELRMHEEPPEIHISLSVSA